MKNISAILSILILGIFLSSCSSERDLEDISWQDEIIFATECGMDGLQCCPEDETSCLHGLVCCTDPNNRLLNFCSEECSYGSLNNFCRDTYPNCNDGMVCENSFCRRAGGANQPCYEGGTCDNDLICSDGMCLQCGLSDNPCCRGDLGYQCLGEGSSDESRNACIEGTCRKCGFSPFSSCPDEPFCNFGFLNNNKNCLKCGNYNQPCCKDSDLGSFCQNEDLKCENGFCL